MSLTWNDKYTYEDVNDNTNIVNCWSRSLDIKYNCDVAYVDVTESIVDTCDCGMEINGILTVFVI